MSLKIRHYIALYAFLLFCTLNGEVTSKGLQDEKHLTKDLRRQSQNQLKIQHSDDFVYQSQDKDNGEEFLNFKGRQKTIDKRQDIGKKGQPNWMITTTGCYMQNYSANSSSSLKHFKEKFPCQVAHTYSNRTIKRDEEALVVDYDLLKTRNVSRNDISCCYKSLRRVMPNKSNVGENLDLANAILGEQCEPMQDSQQVDEEYIVIVCDDKKKNLKKTDVAPMVVPKRRGEVKPRKRENERFSLLIIGMKGVSRLNAHRHLKKTLNILQIMGFVEILGLTSTSGDTFGNIMPLLTGETSKRLVDSCSKNGLFDDCHFIWDDFKKKKYLTAFFEDVGDAGLFTNQNYGFRVPPTDYYSKPMFSFLESCCRFDECIGLQAYGTLNTWLPLDYYLDYSSRLIVNLTKENLPLFGFFWSSSIPWTEMNPPHSIDNYYFDFLSKLHQNKVHEKSAIVFLSDSGAKQGDFAQTEQGLQEQNLPFASILFPPFFHRKYKTAVQNFIKNAKSRMVTGYDLEATFKDIFSHEYLSHVYEWTSPKNAKGISLFTNIPEERTCEEASVPSQMCPCIK